MPQLKLPLQWLTLILPLPLLLHKLWQKQILVLLLSWLLQWMDIVPGGAPGLQLR